MTSEAEKKKWISLVAQVRAAKKNEPPTDWKAIASVTNIAMIITLATFVGVAIVEQLKRKLFEIGVAVPYILADALAGAFEEAVDEMVIVKRSRSNNQNTRENTERDNTRKDDSETIDVEFDVIK